ncbi:MAG: ATP-binding domain-containing protein, partial [Deltaproteobacteria bacterium]
RTHYVGDVTDPDERIVHWTHHLARPFYEQPLGEPFEVDVPGFLRQEVELARKASVVPRARVLERVVVTDEAGVTTVVAGDSGFRPEGAEQPAKSTEGLHALKALLTREQYLLVAASHARALIVQGCAGSGKTSVALHRLAWLVHPKEDGSTPLDPKRALVVMFNKGLSSFVRQSLDELGLTDVPIDTFHGWALRSARRAYHGALDVAPVSHPFGQRAAAIKKQLGVLRALDAFVVRQEQAAYAWLRERLGPYDALDWADRAADGTAPVVRRIAQLRTESRAGRDAARGSERERLAQVHAILDRAVVRLVQYKEELLRFLTDVDLLAEHLPSVPGADIEALAAFQREVQEFQGTDRRPGPRVTFEDLALLLWLMHRKNGGYPLRDLEAPPELFDHLVIDEAQDFGAVELRVLLASVRARTGVAIVGDENQKIVPHADFIGWDALARELGIEDVKQAKLRVPHRATGPIMALAGRLADEPAALGRPGPVPLYHRAADSAALEEWLAEQLVEMAAEQPGAHLCVVTRHRQGTEMLTAHLRERLAGLVDVRHAHNDSWRFAPGVTVTNANQIKGLEFDAVFVVEPTAANYPPEEAMRRLLYTVLTRARDRLLLVGTDEPSPMLVSALEAGQLEWSGPPRIVPVKFEEAEEMPF